jgi:hypothetical protein
LSNGFYCYWYGFKTKKGECWGIPYILLFHLLEV